MKIKYILRFYHNIEKTRCTDYVQTTYADSVQELGGLLYLYRGGFVWMALSPAEVVEIER